VNTSNCIDLHRIIPCDCLCHRYPNNIADCMECPCRPTHAFKKTIDNSAIIDKLNRIDLTLHELYKQVANIKLCINKLTMESHPHGCMFCDGPWNYIGL